MSGKTFHTFNVIDDYNREGLGIEVDLSLPSLRVIRALEQMIQWRDKFLNFEANINPVGTASAGQVRKPIYKSSMNKWENYQPQIDLLIRQLKGQ